MKKQYIFKSERLGFRSWLDNDLNAFAELNADREVMKHFPNVLSNSETKDFIKRLQKHFNERGYCYYAVEILDTSEFIGFIGIAYQSYNSKYTPAIDIGWRLKKSSWGKGFATEGAQRCLVYAFEELKIERLISTCTLQNSESENVMKKIGMKKLGYFTHPKLKDYPAFERCICYEITRK